MRGHHVSYYVAILRGKKCVSGVCVCDKLHAAATEHEIADYSAPNPSKNLIKLAY